MACEFLITYKEDLDARGGKGAGGHQLKIYSNAKNETMINTEANNNWK